MAHEFAMLLLEAPESQLSHAMRKLIAQWDDTPTSLQVLEVVDKCIHFGEASGFALSAIQTFYDITLKANGDAHADIARIAPWRGAGLNHQGRSYDKT